MGTVQVFYLSGTGNSLRAANELQKRIPETVLTPIAGEIGKTALSTSAEAVGFIFPVHYLTLPRIVADFITKLNLATVRYIFAIGTRGGTPSNAFKHMDKLLKSKGKKLDAAFLLNMGENDMRFRGYVTPTPEKIAQMESAVHIKLREIESIIKNRQPSRGEDTEILHPFSPALVKLMSALTPLMNKKERTEFYSDEKCTGCGTCAKVCLSHKITMKGDKPTWRKETPCYACFACINYCPAQAVQIKSTPGLKSYTSVQGRYHHPDVTANEIAEQKL